MARTTDRFAMNTLSPTHWALPPIEAYASGVSRHVSTRWDAGARNNQTDDLIEEIPVSLEFSEASAANPNQAAQAIVMMATPMDLEAFALGFALNEGIVDHPKQVLDIHVVPAALGMAVLITLAQGLLQRVQERQRGQAATSSCGLCGLSDMQAALYVPSRQATTRSAFSVSPAAVLAAFKDLPSRQILGAQTGAAHAAAMVNAQGEILALAEDAGRHNALDKLVGKLAQQGLQASSGFCAVTSRASFEMVQKAAQAGFPMLAAISAPTALAVRMALESGTTLCAFVRGDRLSCFAHAQRLG